MYTYIEIINKQTTYTSWWKSLAQIFLIDNLGGDFSIHCWSDEQDTIQQVLQYGNICPSDWKYGSIISGKITQNFIDFILNSPQLDSTLPQGDRKISPFFNLFLGESFYSSHYGSEITFISQPHNSEISDIIDSLLAKDLAVSYSLDS